MIYENEKFFSINDTNFNLIKFSRCLALQFTFTPLTFRNEDYDSYL